VTRSASLPAVAGALLLGGLASGCSSKHPQVAAQPVPTPPDTVIVTLPAPPPDTVLVKDPELEQRAQALELKVLERDAQLEELQSRLDEARQEVVRSMAKLQSLATRAEAASAIAEAEVAVQSLKKAKGGQRASESNQAAQLLQQSSDEFNNVNYGGALYLANQAKRVAGEGKARLSGGGPSARPGEVPFSAPVRLQALRRCNVREGPGTSYKILFTVETGGELTGFSHTDTWVRVTDEASRSGWVLQSLVGKGSSPG